MEIIHCSESMILKLISDISMSFAGFQKASQTAASTCYLGIGYNGSVLVLS